MNGLSAFKSGVLHSRRLWILAGIVTIIGAVVAALLLSPATGNQHGNQGVPQIAPSAAPPLEGTNSIPTVGATNPVGPVVSPGEPETLDFKAYAEATAKALYSWDSRASTYTEVYGHVRSWWVVLADGSNPLTVYTHEFEGTGINAAAFAQLSSYRAYRTADVVRTSCDGQLAQVKDQPAPWVGLHVCTMTLSVTDRSTTAPQATAYRVPVSVMVNCPPASTAPANRCVLVGFNTTASRIVY
jgi:hypothetical protein